MDNTRRTIGSLSVGDVVLTLGVMCLVTDAPTVTTHSGGRTYMTRALVLNAGDRVIPLSWLCDDAWVQGVGWTSDPAVTYAGRWTLQGNDHAHVSVIDSGKTAADFGLAPHSKAHR